MSAGEIGIILIVGLVVVGPKRLPQMMRSLGKWVAKLRRLSTTLRDQSGIDRILREEGLDKEIRELRALRESLSKSAVLESLMQAANKPAASPVRPAPKALPAKPDAPALDKATGPVAGPEGASTPPLPEKAAEQASDAASPSEADKASSGGETASPAPSALKVAEGSDGSATTSTAAALIQPAVGSIPRGAASTSVAAAAQAAAPPAVATNPLPPFREREYPVFGPDHYEAFPDDLEEEDDLVGAAGAPPLDLPEGSAEPKPQAGETSP